MVNPARTRIVTNTIQLPGTGKPYLSNKPVTIRLNVPAFIDGGTVEKIRTRYADIDDTGTWSLEHEVNEDMDPAGTSYTAHEAPGVSWTYIVPAGTGTLQLRDILVVDPDAPDPLVAGITVVDNGDGTFGLSGLSIIDNGDGTFDIAPDALTTYTKAGADAAFGGSSGGTVTSVTAGDGTITVGGTPGVAPTVKVTPNTYQPLDSDLTAIAALTTTSYGRALLALVDAAAGRTAFGLGTAATSASGDFQPIDSDLTAIAALTTTSYGRALLALADAAALRTAAGLGTAAVVNTGTSSGDVPLLSAGGVLPIARLATGTPDGTKFVRDDGTLVTPAGGSSAVAEGRGKYGAGPTTLLSMPGIIPLSNGASTFALSANRAQYTPGYRLNTSVTIDQIVIEITTAQAASHIRVALYAATTDWQPTGPALLDSGSLSTAATGVIATTITPVVLPAGRYVAWTNCDTAGLVLRAMPHDNHALGYSTTLGAQPLINQTYAAQTYAAPPASPLAWDSTAAGQSFAWVWLRESVA